MRKTSFPYIEKWLSNTQINQKFSNLSWKSENVTDAQITQTLKFRYAQYMGNHKINIFWPLTHPNPNCHTMPSQWKRHMAPSLINMWWCEHPYLKGLRIARHTKAVHLITQTLQAHKTPGFFTLTNAGHQYNTSPEQTIPEWLLNCTCIHRTCQCQAKLRPDITCIIGTPSQTQAPITPSPKVTVQLIEFTYCHDIFIDQALTHKHNKYDPLINTIQNRGWQTTPFITITAGVRGAIHEHSSNKLANMKIPKSIIKTLMKNIHLNAIKYLTYLVLNKRKLENKHIHVLPPP